MVLLNFINFGCTGQQSTFWLQQTKGIKSYGIAMCFFALQFWNCSLRGRWSAASTWRVKSIEKKNGTDFLRFWFENVAPQQSQTLFRARNNEEIFYFGCAPNTYPFFCEDKLGSLIEFFASNFSGTGVAKVRTLGVACQNVGWKNLIKQW